MSKAKENTGCTSTTESSPRDPNEKTLPTLHSDVNLNINMSINDVVDRFSGQLGGQSELTTNRDDLSPYELIEKASGGSALKGVLVTNGVEDCIDLRKTVLEKPRDIVLKSPISLQRDHVVEFTSQAEADRFCRLLDTMGHGIATSVKGSQFGFQAEANPSEAGLSIHEGGPYLARVLYSYVPTAVCDLDQKKLRFDDSALEELKELDELLLKAGNEWMIQKKSECFLKDYGSHVNVGSIEFGGIYRWQAALSGKICSGDSSQVAVPYVGEKENVGDNLGGPLSKGGSEGGASLSGQSLIEDGITDQAAVTHSRDMAQTSTVAMNVTRKGGPQEAMSLSMWKEGLVKYNDTWAVIDRGSTLTKHFVGIWEIVANNEREFTDAGKLAAILHTTWQVLSGKVPELPHEPDAKKDALSSFREFLSKIVSSWMLDEDLTSNAPGYLKELDEKIKEYYSIIEGDTLMAGKLKHEQVLSGFLMKIMRIKRKYTPSQLQKVQDILRELLKTGKDVDLPLMHEILEFVDFQKVTRETILNQLGLEDYYPSKITLQDVMAVQERNNDLTNLPWLILQKLVMLDYKCRESEFSKVGRIDEARTDVDGDKDVIFEDFMKMITSDMGCETMLNPLDVFLAVYACCDMILKQTVMEKMFLCRLAVPFISPNQLEGDSLVYSQWALRRIIVEWKNEDGIQKKTSAVCQPVKSVAFMQIGESIYSKSALLNNVMSDQPHHTFWNTECPLGKSEIQLADGLVEAQWYLPTGKSDDLFDNATMFLNLRGNATEHRRQVEQLQKMSNVIICCLNSADLEDPEVWETMKTMHDSTATVVLLLSTHEVNKQVLKTQLDGYFSSVGHHHKTTTKLVSAMRGNRQRTKDDLKQELRQILQEALMHQTGMSIEDASKDAQEAGMHIDENDDFCKKAKLLADQVISCMEDKTTGTCKMEMLPLQSREWDMLLKAAQSTGGKTSSVHDMAKIEQERKKLQEEKLKACNRLSPLIETFLRNLVEVTDSPAVLLFLQWLKIYFDEICRNTLPDLHEEYFRKWKEIETAKTEANVESMNNELEAMEKRLGEASLGVEHLLREVGEIYAVAHETQNKSLKQLLDILPEVAAKLLLKGEPIELMDGDAPNVPLAWVKAVFSSLMDIVGGKKLFVISVLGIQRSGKSTMLNTMFGLQFPVSAGRCTRGAFLQLLKVDKTRSDLPYDYVLVVDTEGLHAAELGEVKHDNDIKLATFVVGLGDVTILNTMGEDVSEISDVLQTTVHSFIKMKFSNNNFRTHRTCRFTHQNVPDVNANLQLQQGSQALQEQLDKITAEVCNSEKKVDGVQKFRDIIKFDSETDVWYFPALWYGDPPMAPANPGYAAKVQDVRKLLLYDLPQKGQTFLTFSDLGLQVEDLWKGVLSDDFEFHFQNSLEDKAYDSLERTYQEQLSNVRTIITEWLAQTAAVKLEQCTTKEELETQYSELMTQLKKRGGELTEKACAEFEQYFESHNLKDILIKWKLDKTRSLRNELTSFLQNSEKELEKLKERAGKGILQRREETDAVDQIMKKTKDFANKEKGQTVDDKRPWEKVFDQFWNGIIGDFKAISATIRDAAYKLFMNIINQNSEEVIAADLLAGHMEELVKQTVRKGMANKVVNELVSYFTFQKSNLLIRILKDLAEGGFEDYESFINDSKSFGLKWITSFTNKKIFDNNDEAGSEYSLLAVDGIKKLVQSIEDCIKSTTENVTKQPDPDIKMWVREFCTTINTLPITEADLKPMAGHSVKDFRNLESLLLRHLSDMDKRTKNIFKADKPGSIQWKDTPPYQQILDRLWGCEAQCPFCYEVCQRSDPNHLSPNDSHHCMQHRPSGVKGVRNNKTEVLFVEACNFTVQSDRQFYCSACSSECKKSGRCTKEKNLHPYKEYKTFLPDWHIAPSSNMESSKYWMWVMAKYKHELARMHKAKAPDIPGAWDEITKQEAVESLHVYRN